MCATDDTQATITIDPVNRQGQTLALDLTLQLTIPMPDHDAHLPDRIESRVHHVGLQIQRQLFRALIEKADQELVLQRRRGNGGEGIQCRGTPPFTFKTIFGEVTVKRSRITHKRDGTIETPSARAWGTPHQLAITRNLRDAVCDQMSDRSVGESVAEICESAGDEDLLGRGTIVEIVHQEGERLVAAQGRRTRSILEGTPEDELALLGTPTVDVVTRELSDVPPGDESAEERAEWEQVLAQWAAAGFPGCEPAHPVPVSRDEPREVDPGWVIVEPDEVKTKAQPSTGRKEVWTYTAMVLVSGWRYAVAESSAAGLWLQVGALLCELGALSGARRLLVLGDGASWIRTWFEGLGMAPKAMIVCWWHLRKRCYESLSTAGGDKPRRRAFEKELLGLLWEGKVDAAVELLRGAMGWVRAPSGIEDLIGYLKKRRAYIPDYQRRHHEGLWIASTRVEKFNDWAVSERCKHRGMSWCGEGVLALAVLEAARRNGELDGWRRDRELPERTLPEPVRKVA